MSQAQNIASPMWKLGSRPIFAIDSIDMEYRRINSQQIETIPILDVNFLDQNFLDQKDAVAISTQTI